MLQRGIIRPELVFQEEMVVKSFCHISSKALCEGIPTNIYAARIKFKSLMLAYRVIASSAPTYLNALVRANVTPRMLRSSSKRRLALPSVQVRQSRLFSFVVPRWWNELPSTTRVGASLSTFKKLLKTQLSREHLPS